MNRNGVVTNHHRLFPGHRGKRRKPATLFIHAHVRADHVFLLPGIEQQLQGMERPIGVPDSIINIEVMTLRIVHGVVVTAEVLAILGNIGHAAQRTIEGGIEDRALPVSSAH